MKQVTVKTPYDSSIKYMMIESVDDVKQYSDMIGKGIDATLVRLLKSDVSVDRWDHLITKGGPDGGAMNAAFATAYIRGTNPIYEVGPIADTKIRNILTAVMEGERVLVNVNGGYCHFDDNYHTMLTCEEYTDSSEPSYIINENTKYINLENDPDLENRTKEYLTTRDPNFSYITNLRSFSKSDLIEVFREFVRSGGEVVYVYTTGIDIPQMIEYSMALVTAGIKKVEFEFTVEQNEDHDSVITFLETSGVSVTVITEE
jgi:hypothetical protein